MAGRNGGRICRHRGILGRRCGGRWVCFRGADFGMVFRRSDCFLASVVGLGGSGWRGLGITPLPDLGAGVVGKAGKPDACQSVRLASPQNVAAGFDPDVRFGDLKADVGQVIVHQTGDRIDGKSTLADVENDSAITLIQLDIRNGPDGPAGVGAPLRQIGWKLEKLEWIGHQSPVYVRRGGGVSRQWYSRAILARED